MSENLTTRDVFQQLDTRVGRVEVDIRDSRAEMNTGFVQLRGETNTGFAQLRGEMNAGSAQLRDEMNAGFAQLRDEMNTRFDRVFGILVGLVVGIGALLVGVAGIWLKT